METGKPSLKKAEHHALNGSIIASAATYLATRADILQRLAAVANLLGTK
jgi:hypothetical protein